MFGTFRFLLALMVMLTHLWTGLTLWAGPYAVFGFFLLSGYLMARVLDRSYASAGGTRRFFTNRALRIYPPYLAALSLSALLVVAFPVVARSLNPDLTLPTDPIGWLRNLAIFTLHFDQGRTPALISPAWSIDIELCLYLAIGLVARRSVALTAIAVGLCGAYTAYLLAQGAPFPQRYASVVAGGLPFGIGALVYHGRDRLAAGLRSRNHVPIAAAVFACNSILPFLVPRGWAFGWGFYVSIAASAYLVAASSRIDPRRIDRRWARLDAFLGALSYPVFLCHWQAAVVVIRCGLAAGKGPELFLWSLPLTVAAAYLIHVAVERPIEGMRTRVRGQAG